MKPCSHCGGTGQEPPTNGLTDHAKEVLAYLNLKAGRQYRPVRVNLELIAARLRDGATVAQCKAVVSQKCHTWGQDDKMRDYLRPATIFGRIRFEQYLGQLPASAFEPDRG